MLCQIGEVEVWRILELNGPFLTPERLFPNAGPAVAEIIERHMPGGLCPDSGRLILPVQGFLLKTPTHVILVDSCVGNDKTNNSIKDWHQRSDTRFLSALAAAGVTREDVDYVMCTHLHVDHVGWNTMLVEGRWVPTFPNAKYLLPADDEELQRERATDMYTESVLPVIEAGQAEKVSAGHMLGDYITLVPTPGHTPGHVSVQIESGGRAALITGDAIHTTAQCWHAEWLFQFDEDAEQAVASRRRLLETAADTRSVVLGTHFKLPSIGHVVAEGDAFRWEGSV